MTLLYNLRDTGANSIFQIKTKMRIHNSFRKWLSPLQSKRAGHALMFGLMFVLLHHHSQSTLGGKVLKICVFGTTLLGGTVMLVVVSAETFVQCVPLLKVHAVGYLRFRSIH